jgi:hypothetical protein
LPQRGRTRERFIITAGESHFTLDGEERVAGPGETIIVRSASVAPRELGPGDIQAVVERPARP